MKSLMALVCCALLVFMAGCGQPPKTSSQIELWHWMTDRQEALEVLAQRYEALTGVKIKLELFAPSDTYIQKITAAAQANVLPDIYGVLDKKAIFAKFIKAGLVTELSAEFMADDGAWEGALFSKALDTVRFTDGNVYGVKPGLYGVPIDVMNVQMLYNRALLRKAGIQKPPVTFEEWLAAIDSLKRVGVAPFVSGFGEMWMIDCFVLNYAFNIMGQEKVMATFRGEVPYTDPDWIRTFTIVDTLAKRGAFINGIVTKVNKYAEQDFALERAAFAFNGSWCVNVYGSMNPALDFGVMPLPAANAARPMTMWGGAGSSFVVNPASPGRDQAVAFLKWLTDREQQIYLAETTNNLPANREALTSIPRVLADFARGMENTTHPTVWPLNEDPQVAEVFDKGIQAIIIRESTPAKVAAAVQAAKKRQMDRKK